MNGGARNISSNQMSGASPRGDPQADEPPEHPGVAQADLAALHPTGARATPRSRGGGRRASTASGASGRGWAWSSADVTAVRRSRGADRSRGACLGKNYASMLTELPRCLQDGRPREGPATARNQGRASGPIIIPSVIRHLLAPHVPRAAGAHPRAADLAGGPPASRSRSTMARTPRGPRESWTSSAPTMRGDLLRDRRAGRSVARRSAGRDEGHAVALHGHRHRLQPG